MAELKLGGYDFYKHILGEPKFVVAPMVDQSELAWRKLSRRYGAQLIYTPMINAKMFAEGSRRGYRDQNFNVTHGEEGGFEDRPLIVQFCANNADQLLRSAQIVAPHCDAVDINLGCPQDIARKGHYGCFLQDDWDLIYKLINTLHTSLSVPVTAKFRVFPTVEKTVQYAQMLERAGAQILTCHGRTREQRGHKTGLADWEKIRAVKEAVSIPVFANGNILFYSDIDECLLATGADAVMSAEGQLYNPALFSQTDGLGRCRLPFVTFEGGVHPRHCDLALEYLDIVKSLKTMTALSAVKGHLFKVLRPGLSQEIDLRDKLGKIRSNSRSEVLEAYTDLVKELKHRMDRDALRAESLPVDQLVKVDAATGLSLLPHWLAQPYFRPLQGSSYVEKPDSMEQPVSELEKSVDAMISHGKRARPEGRPRTDYDMDETKRSKVDRTSSNSIRSHTSRLALAS